MWRGACLRNDFAGLVQRLDYVASLGVDVIWLLPFYASPLRAGGCEIADEWVG